MSNDLIDAIRSAMPPDAELRVVNRLPGFDVGVSWKLDDDPERPNKPSKTIVISITDEAAEDFANASGSEKQDALERLQKFWRRTFESLIQPIILRSMSRLR